MKTKIEILGNRLKSLIGNLDFRSDFDKALDSPGHLLGLGEHNIRELKKLETMPEEKQERIQSLFAIIFADVLQEEAIAKYSNMDDSSIRQVLYSWFNRPEDRVFEDRLRQTAKLALLGLNLTEEQSDAIMKAMYDILPQVIIEAIEEIISPLRLFPRAEAHSIAMALADMMKGAAA